MPLLYRKVVPNVPAWTADNGALCGRGGSLSYRAEMTAAARMSGTIYLGPDLIALGFPAAVGVSAAADCYRWSPQGQRDEPWWDYGDTDADAGIQDGYAWKFHADLGYGGEPLTVQMGPQPAVYPNLPDMASNPDTALLIAPTWRFGHDWTAAHAYARWHGQPTSRAGGWSLRFTGEDPFQDPNKNLGIAVAQAYDYEGLDPETGTPVQFHGRLLVAGAAMGTDQATQGPDFAAFVFRDENVWPLDNFRLGSGHDLWFEGVTDFWNIADIDLKITLAAAYA